MSRVILEEVREVVLLASMLLGLSGLTLVAAYAVLLMA